MADFLNANIAVAQPDANGDYEWMAVRAGQPSSFGSGSGTTAITMNGDLDLNSHNIVDNTPLFYALNPNFALSQGTLNATVLSPYLRVAKTGRYLTCYFGGKLNITPADLTGGNHVITMTMDPAFTIPTIDALLDAPFTCTGGVQGNYDSFFVYTDVSYDSTANGGQGQFVLTWEIKSLAGAAAAPLEFDLNCNGMIAYLGTVF